jgi:D-glycero-D-manno-heptose 1,7-bisphosphate phosphatase
MRKAIFLDRDGTLNIDIWYAYKKEDCQLVEENVWDILRKFQGLWYLLIIVTNQAGIDKWYYEEKDFYLFMDKLKEKLQITFDGIYFCPYHPDFSWESILRKPNNGMLLQAQIDFGIDFSKSFMIGDNEKDIQAWAKSWCTTILYNSQKLSLNTFKNLPDFCVESWREIERIIV